jgi:hypothetical protein
MKITCEAARELLLEGRFAADAGPAELREHLEGCAACATEAGRGARVVASLATMARAPAPRALDGLVVATMHEGYRQDRAVAALQTLGRLTTPGELTGRTLRSRRSLREPWLEETSSGESSAGAHAPAVLERLVDENLRRGSADAGRRFASRLDRLRAPRILRGRLRAIDVSARSLFRSDLARRGFAVAAAVIVLLGGTLWFGLRRGDLVAPMADLRIRHESSLDALDPMARSLLGGLSGGLLDAPGRKP